MAAFHELLCRCAVTIEPFGLKVRRVRSANLRPLVPIDAEPPQSVEDTGDHFRLVSLDVGVFDAQDEAAAVAARVQPVEQRSPGAADVQVTGRGRGEAETRSHGTLSSW